MPGKLRCILGALSVGYSGYPLILKKKSTVTSCKTQSDFKIDVQYLFPAWLMQRTLIMLSIMSSTNVVHGSLKMINMCPVTAPLFVCSLNNDVRGLQALFGSRLADPNSVLYPLGRSVLTVSSLLRIYLKHLAIEQSVIYSYYHQNTNQISEQTVISVCCLDAVKQLLDAGADPHARNGTELLVYSILICRF